LARKIFQRDGTKVHAECPAGDPMNWGYITWKAGGVREYYVNKGRVNSLQECQDICEKQGDCYFVTMTASSTCYLLTTASMAHCRYLGPEGHFGKMVETCDNARPCPSAYKQCFNPKCALLHLSRIYCQTSDEERAIKECTL